MRHCGAANRREPQVPRHCNGQAAVRSIARHRPSSPTLARWCARAPTARSPGSAAMRQHPHIPHTALPNPRHSNARRLSPCAQSPDSWRLNLSASQGRVNPPPTSSQSAVNRIRGFCYPLTPGGVSSLVGDLPWHYATEYLTIAYRTDPAAIAAYLPEPLAPGPEPDLALRASIRKVGLVLPSERIAFATFDILGDVLPADAGGDRALHVADS